MNNFYTYAYLREDGTLYYIGKGKGKRVYSKTHSINVPKDKSRILFLKKNLTEEEAFKHEKYMIAILGRKDLGTGILRNLTEGGDGCSGFNHSDEFRKKMSDSRIGEKNPMYGKKHSEEHKRMLSQALSGENHPLYGKSRSDETRKKISESNKGKIRSEDSKRKISDSLKGEKNHFYGKKHSEETKKKISESKLGKTHSEESKRKMCGRTFSEETKKKMSESAKNRGKKI